MEKCYFKILLAETFALFPVVGIKGIQTTTRNILLNKFERFLGQATFAVLEYEDPGSLGQQNREINEGGVGGGIGKEIQILRINVTD